MTDQCPICFNDDELCYTECNHGYCICCLSKIKTCALCRSPLLRVQVCKEIRAKCSTSSSTSSSFSSYVGHWNLFRMMAGMNGVAYS